MCGIHETYRSIGFRVTFSQNWVLRVPIYLLAVFDSECISGVKVFALLSEPVRRVNQSGSVWNVSRLLSHSICTPQRHLSYGTVGGGSLYSL